PAVRRLESGYQVGDHVCRVEVAERRASVDPDFERGPAVEEAGRFVRRSRANGELAFGGHAQPVEVALVQQVLDERLRVIDRGVDGDAEVGQLRPAGAVGVARPGDAGHEARVAGQRTGVL